MAGKNVYLGGMIQSLKDDMAQMSADLKDVVQELINVKTVTAQGISELNVVASDNVSQVLNNPAKSFKGSNDYVYNDVCTMNSLMNGSCKIEFDAILTSQTTIALICTLYYTINGGTRTETQVTGTVSKGATDTRTFAINLPINKGDSITVGLKFSGGTAAAVKIEEKVVKICYDAQDLVNQGGMALV